MSRCPDIEIVIKHKHPKRGYIVPVVSFPVLHGLDVVEKTPELFLKPPKKARTLVMLDQLPITHQVTLSVVFKDAKGNPAQVDEPPQWNTDNTEVLAVTPAADGLSCVVRPVGPISNSPTTVTVTADADLGEGMKTLVGTFVVNTVTAGEAVVVEVTAGAPEPIPEEPVTPGGTTKAKAKRGKKY